MNNAKKIFCIGLNKTGTSSFHEAIKILGFKSVHFLDDDGNNIKDIVENNYLKKNDILKGLEKYDAFSDWNRLHDIAIFKEFDKQYPGSKFIMNTRDINAWLDSREKHVKRNQEKKRRNPEADVSWLKIERAAWEKQFTNHYAAILAYFEERPDDLLVFDVTKGDGWEKLCPFLGLPVRTDPFPKKNVASKFKTLLNRFWKQG